MDLNGEFEWIWMDFNEFEIDLNGIYMDLKICYGFEWNLNEF